MWLLSTNRAELHSFPSPDAITGGYAVLSHTWGAHETSYQEIVEIQRQCAATGENPRDCVGEKIRQCCLIAEEHGYDWVWIDTCCINKTSSTELSEAINSMFRWYSCAEICYAYLHDVPGGTEPGAPGSPFRTARWHTRGWTLQELLAPATVVFLAQDWTPLGDKLTLAPLLQEVTGIRQAVLTRESHFAVASVAQRMSWASKRRTTRVEDEAYCLMGLFNVNMPTIYGEGRQAFHRLQHEIMKQLFDTTIFAWGRWTALTLEPMEIKEIYRFFNTTSKNHVYLLANSPASFDKPFNGRTLRFSPNATISLQPYLPWQWKPEHNEPEDSEKRTKGPFGRLELPRFQATSYGVECRLPVFESQGITVAVLLADTQKEHVGLLLHPSNLNMQDPSRIRYNVGFGFRRANGTMTYIRLVSLGADFYNLKFNGKPVTATWRDIYIADGPPALHKDERLSLLHPLNCFLPAPPFKIPHWLIGRLAALGMEVCAPVIRSRPNTANRTPLTCSVTFEDVNAKEAIRLVMGTCTKQPPEDETGPVHWARAMTISQSNWRVTSWFDHACAEDHVALWPGMCHDFGNGERTVRLTFERSRITPQFTLIVHVELTGSVYETLKRTTNVEFPPHRSNARSGVDTTAGSHTRTLTLDRGSGDASKAVTTLDEHGPVEPSVSLLPSSEPLPNVTP